MSEEEAGSSTASEWEVQHDETSGLQFYVNVVTGESSWDPPPGLAPSQTSSTDASSQQWSKSCDENGNVFYVNLETMETRWTPPSTTEGVVADTLQDSAEPNHRTRRPSTAEQMAELNRLLSGDDEDNDDGNDGSSAVDAGEVGVIPAEQAESCAWMMFVNESDGQPYYYNHLTGECVWEPPEDFVRFHNESLVSSRQMTSETAHAQDIDEALYASDGMDELTQSTNPVTMEIPSSHEAIDLPQSDFSSSELEITPELEDKVRRAIEAASKTPIGSSRLLFVRTPTEHHLPTSTRVSNESDTTQRSGRLKTPTPSRPESASLRNISPTPDEDAAADVIPSSTPKRAENVAFDESSTSFADELNNEDVNDIQPMSSVDSQLPAEIEAEYKIDYEGAEHVDNQDSPVVNNQANRSTAAVVLQCAVRCFVSRQRVKAVRRAQADRSEPENTPGAKTDCIVVFETEGEIANQDENELDLQQITASDAITEDKVTTDSSEFGLSTKEIKVSSSEIPVLVAVDRPNTTDAPIAIERETLVVEEVLTVEEAPIMQEMSMESQPPAALDILPVSKIAFTPVSSPISKSSRRSPSRSSTASQLPSVRKKEACVFKSPPQCPSALDITHIFPSRHVRIGQKLVGLNTDNSGISSGRPLAPWMRDPSVMSAVCAVSSSSPEAENQNKTFVRQLAAEKPIPPDLLSQYMQIYDDARQKFESKRAELERNQTNSLLTGEDKQSSSSSNISPTCTVSDEELWASLRSQCIDNQLDRAKHLAKSSYRRGQELETRIKYVEGSIRRVEQQLEAAELCLVTEEEEISPEKRLLQAKFASKLRRRLRSLISAAEYWREKLQNANTVALNADDTLEVHHRSWDGDSALHYAAWRGWSDHVRVLISKGVDVNAVDNTVNRCTALHEACRGGNIETAQLLLEAGASEIVANAAGDTALHIACRSGWPKVVCLLLLWSMGEKSKSPNFVMVLQSVNTGSVESVAALFNARNGNHRRAIDLAALRSLVDFLQAFDGVVQLGADPLKSERMKMDAKSKPTRVE